MKREELYKMYKKEYNMLSREEMIEEIKRIKEEDNEFPIIMSEVKENDILEHDNKKVLSSLDISHRPFRGKLEEVREKTKEELKEDLLNNHRIEVLDDEVMTKDKYEILSLYAKSLGKIKAGKINGFLKSEKNTSYSKDKSYTRENIKGSYQDLILTLKLMSDIGWSSGSGMGKNSENTAFNKVVDKTSFRIAKDILRGSEINNREISIYPYSGLIPGIQALRAIGWTENQIKNASLNMRIPEVVYVEYDTFSRDVSDAKSIQRVILRKAGNKDIHNYLKDKFNWSE